MAKGKHTAALFEVFHGTKILDPRGQAALKTPGWWFKGRADGPEAEAADPNDPTTRPIQSALITSHAAVIEDAAPAVAAPSQSVAPAAPAKPATSFQRPLRRDLGRADRDPADPTRTRAGSAFSAVASRFLVDAERREVIIRLPVTTAIVSAFVIVVVIGFAYIIGRRAAAGLETVAAIETVPVAPAVDVRKSGALDVSRRSRAAASTLTHPRDDSGAADLLVAPPLANTVHGLVDNTADATNDDGPRVIGLNYVIVQSYPDRQTADEACEFLVKHNIPCSVEKAPAGWSAKWSSVVSRRGFEHIHSPECENFMKQIQQVGDKFATKGQFKRFAPMLYAWKGA